MTKTKLSITEVVIKNLYAHPFLEKYGLSKITDFEIAQMAKFDIPVGQVIATKDNAVIHGWDEVLTAKKMGNKSISVLTIDIDADMVIQVTSMKNMRRKLSRIQQAELIVELRHYMNHNEKGVAWKDEIPGDEINKKIGFLIGYSYGMTNQLERIYKYDSGLLNRVDEGEMSLTEAISLLPKIRTQASPVVNAGIAASSTGTDHGKDPASGSSSHIPAVVPVDDIDTDDPIVSGVCGDCIIDPAPETSTGILPTKVKVEEWDFAGEKKTSPCESIEEIVIRFASGKEIKLQAGNDCVAGSVFGKEANNITYGGGKRHTVDNSEFHVFKSTQNSHLQVIIYNGDHLAA